MTHARTHARTHAHGANYDLPPASRAGDNDKKVIDRICYFSIYYCWTITVAFQSIIFHPFTLYFVNYIGPAYSE